MTSMKFSIAIPTRNKCDTLGSTIRSCLNQIDAPDFEIVIFDNCSTDGTAQVIDSFNDSKIRSQRSTEPLCMTDSWESCLLACQGEYVIVIGSDDAILPSTLFVLDDLTKKHKDTPIRWASASYHWENSARVHKRGLLTIPLGEFKRTIQSLPQLKKVINFKAGYESLPLHYNSCVPRITLEKIKKTAGRILLSGVPDVASGMAHAMMHETFLSIDIPLSIAAVSAGSNGSSVLEVHAKGKEDIKTRFGQFLDMNIKAGFGVHESLPQVSLLSVFIADAYLRVSKSLCPNTDTKFNQSILLKSIEDELVSSVSEPLRSKIAVIVQNHFKNKFSSRLNYSSEVTLESESKKTRLGFHQKQNSLIIDVRPFGYHDVATVAEFCEKVMNLREISQRLSFEQKPPLISRIKSSIKTLIGKQNDSCWY